MKTLIIAEKPSVATDLARALGKVKKNGDWYENDEYIISSAVGHVVELFMPEDIDKKLGFWRLGDLPIIPKKFDLKPIEKNEKKYNELKKLMGRKDVESVVNACDAGREGELIFTYLYQAAKCKKPYKRLWMQSMTQESIRSAFADLKDAREMSPLQDAARSRSEADWLIGINGTRAITTRMFGSRRGQAATVGRVQTPTLSIVLERELEIRAFKPRDYWRLSGSFGVNLGEYEGIYQKPDWKKGDDEHDRANRIWDEATAQQILAECESAPEATVTEEKKRTRQSAPRLYDLTTLQREANGRFGYSATRTLQIAQALYEKHKVITYPRTDSKALPEDYIGVVKGTLRKLSDHFVLADRPVENDWVKPNKRIFNNAQISDHFAIIPTGEHKALKEEEQKVYDMIVRRLIAIFFPPAEYDETTRISKVSNHIFKTSGKVLAVAGWLEVHGKRPGEGGSQDELPALSEADGNPTLAKVLGVEIFAEQTKPPPRYTEATLLSAMEGAGKLVDDEELADAMKENGLGTPATRAQIIDHLNREKYIERDGRELIPTAKAENLIEFLKQVKVDMLTQAALTGEWEHKLRQVEEGSMSRDEFMKGIADMTSQIVDRTKNFDESQAESIETDIIAPTDGKPMRENFRAFRSQDGQMVIFKTVGNRKLDANEVRELVANRRVGPLDGFRSKAGKPYSAILMLDDENKIKFGFGNGDDEDGNGEINVSELPVIGTHPKTGETVYAAPNAYVGERAAAGEKKSAFKIYRTILEQTINEDQAKKLLENGKTDLLVDFRSKRTKRKFKAFLTLNDKGGVDFEFPPREPKKKAAKKKTAAKKTAAKTAAE